MEIDKVADYISALPRDRRERFIDELLDLVLTTVNHNNIHPLKGHRLATLIREGRLGCLEGIKLLLEMAMASERDIAVKIIKAWVK